MINIIKSQDSIGSNVDAWCIQWWK